MPTTTTRILLSYCKWDKEILLERFYGDDLVKLFKEAHVVFPTISERSKAVSLCLFLIILKLFNYKFSFFLDSQKYTFV